MKSLTNILERIKLTKEDISGMIRDAKKEKVTEPEEVVQDTISEKIFSSLQTFEAYIKDIYLLKNQSITGLSTLYEQILRSNESKDLKELITSETGKSLKGGEYQMTSTEGELFDIIDTVIKIPNGHASELWFAIVFKGLVVGGKGDTPDVVVDNETVSLKAYGTATFDFGSLDPETSNHLNSFLMLAQLLTNIETENKSLKK